MLSGQFKWSFLSWSDNEKSKLHMKLDELKVSWLGTVYLISCVYKTDKFY